MGFSIIGGTDHSCTPFGNGEPGVFVSHLVPGGIAASSGKLRFGDRILKVDGEDVTGFTHQDVVMTLLKPSDELKLTVRHDPLPEGFEVGLAWSKFRNPPRLILVFFVFLGIDDSKTRRGKIRDAHQRRFKRTQR